jgi:hypothetical protein
MHFCMCSLHMCQQWGEARTDWAWDIVRAAPEKGEVTATPPPSPPIIMSIVLGGEHVCKMGVRHASFKHPGRWSLLPRFDPSSNVSICSAVI